MSNHTILFPILAMVGLTLLVWLWMYVTRIYTLYKHEIDPNELRSVADEQRLLASVAGPSENLVNLFEMPVLFYLGAVTVYITGLDDPTIVSLAWIFVGFRILHSLIHCSYNHVMHRFTAYILSSVSLWGMWAFIAIHILSLNT
ncbi:MAG: MAPEG family protein [Gammaproteobacteria bacterium]|nr:MAPEG family protein [Gammaproteobacteria bacterium]